MDLKFLGTGSAFNTSIGNTCAYIKKKSSLVLLDCGCTAFSKIQKIDLLKEINKVYVLITHFHPDHIGSLGDLIFYTHYVKSFNINVYCPDTNIIKLLRMQGLKEGIHYEYWHTSEDKDMPSIISDNNIYMKILGMKSEHDSNINCYSYCLEEYKTIVDEYKEDKYELMDKVYYSGDSISVNKFIIENINSINRVYHDVSSIENGVHISLNKIEGIIPIEIRKKFYLMHFDNQELIEKAKKKGFNTVEE